MTLMEHGVVTDLAYTRALDTTDSSCLLEILILISNKKKIHSMNSIYWAAGVGSSAQDCVYKKDP